MEAFNYLSVLISIILGLGITQLLTGIARWVEHRATFKPYAPALIWTGILLLIHIQTWWSMFGLRTLVDWRFVAFALVLLQPILLYLMAILVLPSQATATVDVRSNYFGQRRWFFGLLAALIVVSVVKDLVVSGSLPGAANLAFHCVFLAAAIVALSTQGERTHRFVAILSAVIMIAYVALLFGHLQ